MGFVLTVCHVLIVFVIPLSIVISLTTSAAITPVTSLSILPLFKAPSCVVLCLTVVV